MTSRIPLIVFLLLFQGSLFAQGSVDDSLLTVDRIYDSNEFVQDYLPESQWIEDGNAYVMVEKSSDGVDELARYESRNNRRSLLLKADKLVDHIGHMKRNLGVEMDLDGIRVAHR